jgi:hypothetical protein
LTVQAGQHYQIDFRPPEMLPGTTPP